MRRAERSRDREDVTEAERAAPRGPSAPTGAQAVLALQRHAGNQATSRLLQARRVNRTGLPDDLKAGVEALSGVSLDDVRVRFGSSRPPEIGAEAFTHGEEIHVAPGGERHLAHEAWHVVQQAQGRAQPTGRVAADTPINEDPGLEAEADLMGARALQAGRGDLSHDGPAGPRGGTAMAVIQAKGRLALLPQAPALTTEEQLAALNADSDEEVYLTRGVTPTQKKYLQTEMIRGSFISFQKMLLGANEQPPPEVAPPERQDADDYVAQHRTPGAAQLVEFSTKVDIAKIFGSEARYGYVFIIKIRRKYLTKGASGSESGWIARQDAPFDIVRIERSDRLEPDPLKQRVALTESEFQDAVAKEQIAEYLVNLEDPTVLAQHFQKFSGAARLAEAQKYAGYKKGVGDETKAETSQMNKT